MAEPKIFCNPRLMLIRVKTFPDASEDRVIKKSDTNFEVFVREKPQLGRATRRVLKLLAEYFQINESNVRLIKGFKERNKIFEIGTGH